MKRAFDNVLSRRWQASATFIGKLCTETDRWQAALRRMQAPLLQMKNPVNLAEILRARTDP